MPAVARLWRAAFSRAREPQNSRAFFLSAAGSSCTIRDRSDSIQRASRVNVIPRRRALCGFCATWLPAGLWITPGGGLCAGGVRHRWHDGQALAHPGGSARRSGGRLASVSDCRTGGQAGAVQAGGVSTRRDA